MMELQNLYALSELAQHIIKDLAKRHSWALQSFPMKVKLPAGILRPLPNVEAANKVLDMHFSMPRDDHFTQCFLQVLKQVFLPPEALDWLEQTRLARANATELKTSDRPKTTRKFAEKRKKDGSRSNGHVKCASTNTKYNRFLMLTTRMS
jgi:sister chromatid cohesion protein PDS5